MLLRYATVATIFAVLGIASALPGGSDYSSTYTPTSSVSPPPYSTYTPPYNSSHPHPGGDCGPKCGGECGDGTVQAPEECDLGAELNNTPGSGCDSTCHRYSCCGDGVVEAPEECDAGALNGVYGSGCSTDCTFCGYCGDGVVDDVEGEQCDDGWHLNGTPGSNCSATCQFAPVTCSCGCSYEKTATGATEAECEANCQAQCTCQTCNPSPPLNFCDITTSCITTPTNNDYCACRAGYRADGLNPTDSKQFRLAFPGQEYRVFVAPGVSCNTLCTNPFPGPLSCQEVPVQSAC